MSGSNPVVMKLLAEQRKRCLATILTAAENSSWWSRLSDSQQGMFREQVRSALSIFYDLSRDLIKVTDEDSMRNELALDLIRSVHTQTTRITERLDADIA